MNEKVFMNVDEQIERLKKLGIHIPDDEKTKKQLLDNSYYNIVNGYRDLFLFKNQKDKFLRGTRFTELYALYHFDRQLRHSLLSFLLEVETTLKNRIVYAFMNTTDAGGNVEYPRDDYLKLHSYANHSEQSSKNTIKMIAKLQRTISTSFGNSDAVTHYLSNYGYVPLWVLATRMTFGDIKMFYSCLKSKTRQAVAKKYNMSDADLLTHMELLAFIRNHCAHGNRIYCMRKKIDLPLPNKNTFPKRHVLIQANHGKHNLLNVFISLTFFLSKSRYEELVDKTMGLFEILEQRLKTIGIDNVHKHTGLPSDKSVLQECV